MNRPCVHAIPCPGQAPGIEADSPITNFSSEANDGAQFTEIGYVWYNRYDPVGPTQESVSLTACNGAVTCSAPTLEEAIQCALQAAYDCQHTPPPADPESACGRLLRLISEARLEGDSADLIRFYNEFVAACSPDPRTTARFYNQAVIASGKCGDGFTSISVTVPAGTFYAETQQLADAIAQEYANAAVSTRLICPGALSMTDACVDNTFSGTINVAGQGAPFTFEVEGSLPIGLTLTKTGAATVTISGLPAIPGTYDFSVKVTSSFGLSVTRDYTIDILGILNDPTPGHFGQQYMFQLLADGGSAPYRFTINGGGLPSGITLSTAGLLSGTPNDPGSNTFNVSVTDSTGRTCQRDMSLFIAYEGCPGLAFIGTPLAFFNDSVGPNGGASGSVHEDHGTASCTSQTGSQGAGRAQKEHLPKNTNYRITVYWLGVACIGSVTIQGYGDGSGLQSHSVLNSVSLPCKNKSGAETFVVNSGFAPNPYIFAKMIAGAQASVQAWFQIECL